MIDSNEDKKEVKLDIIERTKLEHVSHKLKEHHKKFIVGCLARFEKQVDIQRKLEQLFNLKVNKNTVKYYNPEFLATFGRELSDDLQLHFDTEREKYLNSIAKIPIANSTFRIELLNKMATKSFEQGNYILSSKLCEQVAREVGGMYIAKNFQNSFIQNNNVDQQQSIAVKPIDYRLAANDLSSNESENDESN